VRQKLAQPAKAGTLANENLQRRRRGTFSLPRQHKRGILLQMPNPSRIVLAFLLVGSLAALGSLSAQQKNAPRAGWISDESCAAQHTKPGRADCVQKCWRGGASIGHPEWKPQRAVFVADADQTIWIVENPEAVKDFPAAHVLLAGQFDSTKKTVRVDKISPPAD
jgi:hypothetical protein